VGDIAGRAVTVEHSHRRAADVRQLMMDTRGDVRCLSRAEDVPFLAETHFPGAIDDEIDLLLFLVVPWYLTAVGIQCDESHGEMRRLDRRDASDKILCSSACRIPASFQGVKVCDDHGCRLLIVFQISNLWQRRENVHRNLHRRIFFPAWSGVLEGPETVRVSCAGGFTACMKGWLNAQFMQAVMSGDGRRSGVPSENPAIQAP
jgi:hypothetical protein